MLWKLEVTSCRGNPVGRPNLHRHYSAVKSTSIPLVPCVASVLFSTDLLIINEYPSEYTYVYDT